jgi:hypothetical protein
MIGPGWEGFIGNRRQTVNCFRRDGGGERGPSEQLHGRGCYEGEVTGGDDPMDHVLLMILSASFVAGAWVIYQGTP